ncbi:hypothetical protein VYU27_007328 [Nannochloropsis oceanica]
MELPIAAAVAVPEVGATASLPAATEAMDQTIASATTINGTNASSSCSSTSKKVFTIQPPRGPPVTFEAADEGPPRKPHELQRYYTTKCGKRIYVPDKTLEHMASHPEVDHALFAEVCSKMSLPPVIRRKKLPVEVNLERSVGRICIIETKPVLPNERTVFACRKGRVRPSRVVVQEDAQVHHGRLELFLREISRREPLYFQYRAKEDKDPLWQGDGYKDYYYQSKLGIGPGESEEAREARRAVARSYLEGLYWVLTYYHEGVRSWGWYFPYHYAPLASDLVDLPSVNITFAKGRPYTPLMQLLNVLPSQSGPMLPEPYRDLMTQEDSPLRQFYPPDFETDRNGKQNSWESVVLIPFIDEDLMVSALAQVDHRAALSQEERARNILGKEHTFWPAKGRGPPIGKQLKGITAASRAGRKQHADRGVPQEIVEPDLDD